MKEYTLLSLISVFAAIYADTALKTRLLKNPLFYLFLLVIAGFKLLVNGALTSKMIVQYDPAYYLGLRIGSIPVEDFLFGFSMVVLTVVFWEYFKRSSK